jgi:MerR family transcriptional regulator, thiopeptide resistance regulator
MGRLYRIRDFAALAGVTVKALRHYERLGLLKPRRTSAGHRRYTEADAERVDAITALKYLGFSLSDVELIFSGRSAALDDVIAARRQALAEEETRVGLARAALEDVAPDTRANRAGVIHRLTQVVHAKAAAAAMQRYYTAEQWQRRRRYYEEGPAPEWRELYDTLTALIGEDPASPRVQDAADRWLALSVRAYTGDPAVQTDSPTAWADRARWPSRMKRRLREFNLEAVTSLVQQAARCAPKKYFTADAWTRYVAFLDSDPERISRAWQAKIDLFRDLERAVDSGAAEPSADLRARWEQQLQAAGDGDAALRAGWLALWQDRERWSPSLRWQMEALHMMPFARLARVAEFLDKSAK